MAFHHFILILALLSLALEGSHGALSGEEYWKATFPDTPMPKALKDILPPFDVIHGNGNENVSALRIFLNHIREGSKISNYESTNSDDKNSYFASANSKGIKNFNETVYFFQEDLRPGKMVTLSLLIKPRDMKPFLPRQVADPIPFSSDKLPQLLKLFSVEAESNEAYDMKETIKGCERNVIHGEEMYCVTSFEPFVDKSVSTLGKNIKLLAHELEKETKNPIFTIHKGIHSMGEEELVCHKVAYPYAVFLCHSIHRTAVHRVPLVGIDGTKVNALAVCHKDTSAWSPKHIAFSILNVKPGTVPICHFLARDTMVWVRK